MADEEAKAEKKEDDLEEFTELSTKREAFGLKIDGEAYELRLMSGDLVGTYRNSLGNRMKFNSVGKPAGFSNYKGMESALVSLCLYKAGEAKPVAQAVIDSWAQPTIEKLFKKCLKMNGLDKEGEEKEKKD